MHKRLESFQWLTLDRVVENLPIIILLNMVDIFDQYTENFAVSDIFPDCPVDADSVGACQFFKEKFAMLDRRPEGKLQIYVTSAVDPALFKETSQELCDVLTRSTGRQSFKTGSIDSNEGRPDALTIVNMEAETADYSQIGLAI